MGMVQRIAELETYHPKLTRQRDFEEFWQNGVETLSLADFTLKLYEHPYPLNQVKVFKASLEAVDGTILNGWYLYPTKAEKTKVPALVRFHGYSSNKGKLCELLLWALQGYAILAMDVRGQCGDTPDGRTYTSGSFSGWMTLGINSPLEYYYRQVYLDSIQLIEALARRTEVDSARIGLFGNSQGAALSIVSAALITRFTEKGSIFTAKVAAVNAAVPFLTDMRRSYIEHSDGPWAEFDWYFRMHDPFHDREDQIFECLSYFDAMNFAPWIHCPVLIALGLKDKACPPPTAYALYNHLAGKKEIIPYPDYGHESIDSHVDKQIDFFASLLL